MSDLSAETRVLPAPDNNTYNSTLMFENVLGVKAPSHKCFYSANKEARNSTLAGRFIDVSVREQKAAHPLEPRESFRVCGGTYTPIDKSAHVNGTMRNPDIESGFWRGVSELR